ncbi:MAG TPA: hypothetical protein VL992_11330 [Tepidisphaeraceae bacterium]|nr:hypothetical protein [Tepidisphaeraceae bacterium]
MSTAAHPTEPAAPVSASSGYSIARPQGKCAICGQPIAAGEKFFAAVRETPAGLERLDVSLDCRDKIDRASVLAFWQTTMPSATAVKQKVFVDDNVLCELFERLADVGAEPSKLNFRFVLGLVLMRKKLLAYESTRVENGGEYWTMRLKGRDELMQMLNPRLDEAQIAEVSAQLGQILNGEPA